MCFCVFVARPCAADGNWTNVTSSAPWAARNDHTSVIDAFGSIYVIGGNNGTYLDDVWVSIDLGADRTWAVGGMGTRGVTPGVLRGTKVDR